MITKNLTNTMHKELDIEIYKHLENDMITVSGLSNKLYTYTSTFGGEITIPEVFVTKVE